MAKLSEALRVLPTQLTQHEYSPESFGSWSAMFRIGGRRWRLTFDGREQSLWLQQDSSSTSIPTWGEDVWSHSTADSDPSVAEIVEAIQKHAN